MINMTASEGHYFGCGFEVLILFVFSMLSLLRCMPATAIFMAQSLFDTNIMQVIIRLVCKQLSTIPQTSPIALLMEHFLKGQRIISDGMSSHVNFTPSAIANQKGLYISVPRTDQQQYRLELTKRTVKTLAWSDDSKIFDLLFPSGRNNSFFFGGPIF